MQPIIEVKNLRKSFELKQKSPGFLGGIRSIFKPDYKTVRAVNGLSFNVSEGEILAFIGPNGAGKSTTIKMLIGILYPTSGKISVLGLNPNADREKLAFQIGSVFGQKSQLWYHLPPLDTFNLLAKIYELDQREYEKRRDFLIDIFEIAKLLKTPVRKLSLGERMRCEIVSSLLHKPKVIFLDEPTIGLDVIAKQQIREVIRYLNQEEKVTIFLTSHDAGDVEALAKRTVVINYGSIVFDDSTEKFKSAYIRSKTVEIVTGAPISNFEFGEGQIVDRGKYNLKIELDTSKHSIDRLLKYSTDNFEIKDINIYDPSMEEIIAEIYKEKR